MVVCLIAVFYVTRYITLGAHMKKTFCTVTGAVLLLLSGGRILAAGASPSQNGADSDYYYMPVEELCRTVGKPSLTDKERKAITQDSRIAEAYSFSEPMKYATAFANGWGVTRNVKRALSFACTADIAENGDKVMAIQRIGRNPDTAKPFEECDYLTNAADEGRCMEGVVAKRQAPRDRKIAEISAGFTPAQKYAFDALRAAAKTYFESHAGEEQDMNGSMRGIFYADEMDNIEQRFFQFLMRCEYHHFPSRGHFAESDKKLNETYQKIMTGLPASAHMGGEETKDGLRKTQRAWLKYRDAWEAFARQRYPRLADQFPAWITDDRIQTLIWAYIDPPYTGN